MSPLLKLSMREQDRDSYYDLVGAAESYWRAFQTNGTTLYRRARIAPDTQRGFDEGSFLLRTWPRVV